MKREELDGILIEATGLADPAPVAQTFYVDEDVTARTRLDAVVTVADAVNLSTHLDEADEAAEQIAFADIILMNKVGIADASTLTAVGSRLRAIKPHARIIHTTKCDVALTQVLGLKAFERERVLEIEPDFLTGDHAHDHDDEVTSLSLHSDLPMNPDAFHLWFSHLLRDHGQDLLGSKGIIDMDGEDQRYVIQGMHMLMDGNLLGPSPQGQPRRTRLVFIGRNLDSMDLRDGFEACKAA